MAPRRPGTQPTEADPTLDIGAKRARVEGEGESSTQVRLRARTRTRACKSACTSNAHTLAWLLLWLSVRRGSSLPQRDVSAAKKPLGVAAPPFNTSASAVHYQPPRKRIGLSALERSAAPCALRAVTVTTNHRLNYLRTPTLTDPQDLVPTQHAIDLFQPTAEELAGHDERHTAMTADSLVLVRARSLAPSPTPSTTITTPDTPPNGLVHYVPPHKAPDPTYPRNSLAARALACTTTNSVAAPAQA
eukprot:scaffold28182_cov126-Isochrysis_galbana.AAC.3